jgi:hypothetical protein
MQKCKDKNNIKMDIKKTGYQDFAYMYMAQGYGQVIGYCEHGNES